MPAFQPRPGPGRAGLAALIADPARALVAFDFDGTLSPIVDDPARAYVLPGIVSALTALATKVGQVAIITGRPAGTAVELAGLPDEVDSRATGLERLVVLGQYGFERWDGTTREVLTVDPPPGLDVVRRELAGVLAASGVDDAVIEDKALAVAVHVRRSAEPEQALGRIRAPLLALAQRTGLTAEPGRLVIELRPPGMDKGKALLGLAAETGATALVFAGDDLGDLAAFDAVDRWRLDAGRTGLLVCSGSAEVEALSDRADLVVDGPPGVLAWLTALLSTL